MSPVKPQGKYRCFTIKLAAVRGFGRLSIFLMLAVVSTLSGISFAQDVFPSRPMRLIVPFAPGGGSDISARAMAPRIQETTGQNVVVDNRTGASGNIAIDITLAAAPDGYTMVLLSATSMINPLVYKTRYEVLRDFAPITQVNTIPYVLAVNPAVPAKSVQELISYAKANPGKLNYASSGQGGIIHLAMELFNVSAGIKTVHVPYKGVGAAFVDLLGGNVQMTMSSIVSLMPHARTQRLRLLGVSSATRLAIQPDLPTIAEAGLKNFEVTQWYGILVPAKTPSAVVEQLNKHLVAAATHPDLAKRFAADGGVSVGSTRQQFVAFLKDENAKWAKVVKETGVRGE